MERDGNGRFVKGYKGGPGRPSHRAEADYLKATTSRVSVAEWSKVIDRALKDAKDGDARARQFLAEYLLGKPEQVLSLKTTETVQLARALELASEHGLSAGEIFDSMIALLASAEGIE